MTELESILEAMIDRKVAERLASVPQPKLAEIDAETQKQIAQYQVISCKPYLSKQELVCYLDCSDRSIEEWTQRPADKNPLPVGRVGRDLRFKREKIDEWIEREGQRYWRQKNLKAAS